MNILGNITFEDLYEFYQAAGFIYPDKKVAMEPYLGEIRTTWNQLTRAPNDIFQHFCNSRENKVSSSLCAVQDTDRTWLIQHAAGLRDPAGMLGNLVSITRWAVDLKPCDFVRFVYRPTNKWASRVLGTLATALDPRTHTSNVYNYYKGSFDRSISRDPIDGLSTHYLKSIDDQEFEAALGKLDKKLIIEAKALRPGEIDIEDASGNYAAAGLMRKRDLLVAKRNDRIVGFSLLEHSSLGINFSFLLNAFLITMIHQDDAAERDLISASVNHYIDRGRSLAICLSERGNPKMYESLGLTFLRQYAEFTASVTECAGRNLASALSHFSSCYETRKKRPRVEKGESAYLMEHQDEGKRIREKTDLKATRNQLEMAGLSSGMKALDVGCASGAATIEMARIVSPALVLGLDQSSERLEEARMLAQELNVLNLDFQPGNALNMPFEAETFDFVWSRFFLEYQKDPISVIAEMKRVARTGGLVVNADLDGNCLFHYPIEPKLEEALHGVMGLLAQTGFDPWVGRKLFHYYKIVGFSEIRAVMVPHHLIAGIPSESERLNWRRKINAIQQKLSDVYPDREELSYLTDSFSRLIESPDTFTYSPLIIMIGVK